jgi:N4-gp56 family major capsid protein
MNMVTNKATGISQRTINYAAAEMLAHEMPVEVLQRFGVAKQMPRNVGELMTFRRVVPQTALKTPLVEGATPSASGFRYEDVSVVIRQWGEWIPITDVTMDLHEDNVIQDISKNLGENMGRTNENITWNIIRGGTSVYYANGASRVAVNTPLTLNLQRKITRQLRSQKAKMFTEILSGSVKIGTTPIAASWIAVGHTDLESDIRNMAGFTPCEKYGSGNKLPHEIGFVENVRYVISPDLDSFGSVGGAPGATVTSTNGTNADVYPIIYLGMESYGLVPLRGRNDGKRATAPMGVAIEPPKMQQGDPLGQRGFAATKWWFTALILNQRWMIRAEVAVSSLN